MLNIKTLVTAALVIGTSASAFAGQGGVDVSYRAPAPVVVRDHRGPVVVQPAPVIISQPIRHPLERLLANDTKINSWTGKDTLSFARPMALQQIKLQGETGKSTISQVAIKFANGRTQLVAKNETLTKNGCIEIDLDGNVRNVTGIVIYGKSGARASFDVIGV
ncbi:MAG TPA: hypothetical protein VGC41_27455 [Kofleriaceae bacterium]